MDISFLCINAKNTLGYTHPQMFPNLFSFLLIINVLNVASEILRFPKLDLAGIELGY